MILAGRGSIGGFTKQPNIQNLLDDEEYHLFRVRRLPLTFTDNYPVHLFDTMLHRSAIPGQEVMVTPFIFCMVHPEMEPAILPIPATIVAPHMVSGETPGGRRYGLC